MGCDAHVLVTGGPAEPARDRVEVDLAASAVTLSPGVGLDPGGIGKGYAADLLVAGLAAARFLPPPRRAGGIHPARVS